MNRFRYHYNMKGTNDQMIQFCSVRTILFCTNVTVMINAKILISIVTIEAYQ